MRSSGSLATLLCLAACTVPGMTQTASYSVVTPFPGNTTVGGGSIGQLVQTYNARIYGEATYAGANSNGDFYYATPTGGLANVYEFCATTTAGCTTYDQGLVLASDGNFYGTTSQGGSDGYGTVYKLTPSGTFSVLHTFTDAGTADASYPVGNLVQGIDGNLYGAASQGGNLSDCPSQFASTNGCGTIFKITLDGAYSNVYIFTGGTDGSSPTGGLVQGRDGNLYGVTGLTFFSVSTAGTGFKTLASDTSGVNPQFIGPPAEDSAGNYYAASQSGDTGGGSVVKVTPAGKLSTIYTFCNQCTQGDVPLSPVAILPNGNLIGTNSQSGDDSACETFGCGVIYELTTAGTLSVLYTFDDSNSNGILAGNTPISGMDGRLYGTATNGDECNQCGTLYALTHSPALPAQVAVSFSNSTVAPNAAANLSFTVTQATTDTMQNCYAFGGGTGGGTWAGRVSGTYNATTAAYTGSASITPTAAGTYTYGLTCGGNESGAATLTVATAPAKVNTSTTLTVAPNPIYIGQYVTATATVKKSSGTGTPTGSVTFYADGQALATEPVNSSGVATLIAPTSNQKAGTYAATATYNGDSADNSSTSPAVSVTIKAAAATTTTLSANPSTVTPPTSVTFTAVVKSSAGTPTGTVTFSANGITLGTSSVGTNGAATLTESSNGVPAGKYSVTAKYNGVTAYTASTSNTITETVN